MNSQSTNFTWKGDEPQSNIYAEEGQDQPLKFALAYQVGNDTYKKVSEWFICREFINDWSAANTFKDEYTIYGFEAKKNTDGKWPLLVIQVNSKERENYSANWNLLVQTLAKLDLTNEIIFTDYDDYIVVELPQEAWENPMMMSFISWFIKVCTKKPYTSLTDISSMPSCKEKGLLNCMGVPRMSKILPKLKDLTQTARDLLKNEGSYSIHAYGFFKPHQCGNSVLNIYK